MEFFNQLAAAIGPIGALFAISTGYLYVRNNSLVDRILGAFTADTEFKTKILGTLDNMEDVLKGMQSELQRGSRNGP